MKNLIILLAAISSLASCQKENIQPNNNGAQNLETLNDPFEGQWELKKTCYYNSSGEFVETSLNGVISLEESSFTIQTDEYTQIVQYSVLPQSTVDTVFFESAGSSLSGSENNRFFFNTGNDQSLIIYLPVESGNPFSDYNSYKIIKAKRI